MFHVLPTQSQVGDASLEEAFGEKGKERQVRYVYRKVCIEYRVTSRAELESGQASTGQCNLNYTPTARYVCAFRLLYLGSAGEA